MKSIIRYLKIALGGLLGVQSKEQFEADAKSDSIIPFVVTGLVVTAIFITVIVFVVASLLSQN